MEWPDVMNGLAGLAALVNSLFMWPVIRHLKALEPRVDELERVTYAPRERKQGAL